MSVREIMTIGHDRTDAMNVYIYIGTIILNVIVKAIESQIQFRVAHIQIQK